MTNDNLLWKSTKLVLAGGIALLALIGIGTILYWIFFASKSSPEQGVNVKPETNNRQQSAPILQASLPSLIYGTPFRLVEITLVEDRSSTGSRGLGSFSSGYGSSAPVVNVAIGNADHSIFRLLFESTVMINAISYPRDKDDRDQKVILYDVATHDTNRDGFVNAGDNSVLFFSDLEGTHLTQITPDSLSVSSYRFDKGCPQLTILLVNPTRGKTTVRSDLPNHLYQYDFESHSLTSIDQFNTLLERASAIITK